MSGFVVTDYVNDPERGAIIDFLAAHVTGTRHAAQDHVADHTSGEATTFAARLDEHVVGLVTIRWRSRNVDLAERNIPIVHQLAVAAGHRRHGVATALMDAAEAAAMFHGHTAIATTVGLPEEYGPAQRLYASRGYRPDGRGVCRALTPLKLGDEVILDHDLILWLVKDLNVS